MGPSGLLMGLIGLLWGSSELLMGPSGLLFALSGLLMGPVGLLLDFYWDLVDSYRVAVEL